MDPETRLHRRTALANSGEALVTIYDKIREARVMFRPVRENNTREPTLAASTQKES